MPTPPPPRGRLKLAVRYTPANALGGDVYDFRSRDDNKLGVLVADISGHGVNAALLSGMVKTLAAPLTAISDNPGDVLSGLDSAVEQYFPEGFFCTAFYLRIDENTGTFDYAGVGHPPAIIVGPEGTRLLESEPGLLGIGMAANTETRSDSLKPGNLCCSTPMASPTPWTRPTRASARTASRPSWSNTRASAVGDPRPPQGSNRPPCRADPNPRRYQSDPDPKCCALTCGRGKIGCRRRILPRDGARLCPRLTRKGR